MNKEFWKATGIRCLRSFLSVILGARTGDALITDIDWKVTLIAAVSATFWIFIACLLAGLPEVKLSDTLYAIDNDPARTDDDYFEDDEYEDGDE